MKPALSPQTTGLLPRVPSSAWTSSSTDGSVTTVRTTSTRSCTGAGLKKWTPMTRPGAEVAVDSSVTESEEVLVASTVLGADDAVELLEDRLLGRHRLHDGLDHEVGVGEVLERGGEGDPAQQLGLLGLGHLLALDRAAGGVGQVLAAALDALVVELDADHGVAVAGEDLGDAGTHGAETDDADRGEGAGGGRGSRQVRCSSWRASFHARSRPVSAHVHSPVTWRSRQRSQRRSITTRDAGSSRPSARSCGAQVALERLEPLDLDEAQRGVERPVPRHVAVGAQRHPVVAGPARLLHRRAHQRGTDAPAVVRRQHRRAARGGRAGRAARRGRSRPGGGRRRRPAGSPWPSRSAPLGAFDVRRRHDPVAEVLGEHRPAGVLDRRRSGAGRTAWPWRIVDASRAPL